MTWKPSFEVIAGRHASAEAQRDYLIKLLKLKSRENRELRRIIETMGLERKLESLEVADEIAALERARAALLAKTPMKPKRRWWKFWRRR